MGKVISSAVNYVNQAVKAVTQTKIGATALTVVAGVLLGPLGAWGASAFEKATTDQKIFQLKDIIKAYIDQHKSQIDDAEELEKILEKNFFSQDVFEGIINLGSEIKGNLSILLKDQQEKIETMKNINWAHGEKASDFDTTEDRSNFLTENLINLGRAAIDAISIASGLASGNVLSVGMGAFDLGMMIFTNIKGVYQNIDKIHELQDKKQDLEQYFKPGGEFQKHMMITVNFTRDLVSNLCTISILWNSLMNEFRAWLQLLKIILPGAEVNIFNTILKKIDQNPIDYQLLSKIEELQGKVESIWNSSESYVVKVHLLFDLLRDFENNNHIEVIWDKIKNILKYLSSQSPVYTKLKNYIKGFNDITFLIRQNAHLFSNRVGSTQAEKVKEDKLIFDRLFKRVTISDKIPADLREGVKKVKIVTIVAACTNSFYSEDPNGKRLLGYDIQPFVKNRGYIKFLDSSTSSINSNMILIPQPNPNAKQDYQNHHALIDNLYKKLCQKNHIQYQKQKGEIGYSLYMCLRTQNYQVKGQNVKRLVLYKRIQNDNNQKIYYEELMDSGTSIVNKKDGKICVYQYSYMLSDGKKYQLSKTKLDDSKYKYQNIAFYTPSNTEKDSIPIYFLKHSSQIGERYLYQTSSQGINTGWKYVGVGFNAFIKSVEKSIPIYRYHQQRQYGWNFFYSPVQKGPQQADWKLDGVAFNAYPI